MTPRTQMATDEEPASATRGSFRPCEWLLNGVCKRAFSAPEAMLYEYTIAPALTRAEIAYGGPGAPAQTGGS